MNLEAFWARHSRSLAIPLGGLAILLLVPLFRLRFQLEPPRLPKKAVLEVEALARDEAPRAELALEEITREVERIPKDTPETVRAEVTSILSTLGVKIDQAVGRDGETSTRAQAKLVEQIDRTVPTLRKDLRSLLARVGEKADWDSRFPDLKSLWQGRAPGREAAPGGLPFAPRSMYGFLRILPPTSLEASESLDTELGELAGRSAREIAELKRDVLREFSEHEDDGAKGNELELRKFADQVLRELAGIEGQILDELSDLSKRFHLTLPQVLTAFAVKAGGTSGGSDLGAIETALQGKLAGDTNTNTRAALTNAERGSSQVGSLLGGQAADLSLRKLDKIIVLARDVTNDLQNLIQDANDRLDRIDRERAKGKPDSKVEKDLGKVADRIVTDVNAIQAEIQKGEIKIAGGAASSLLPAVQSEFVNQTRLLATRVETALSTLIDRLRGELGQATNPTVQGKITSAILALRGLDRNFDTTPIGLVFTAPAPNTITNAIPAITFTMSSAGSGPNPASRQLLAINNGPVTPGTSNLTSLTTVVLNDQVSGTVNVAASGLTATSIQDGFITLQASGTNFANSPPTVATDPFVLDRVAPAVTFTSPTNGGSFTTTTVPLSATISDTVSGVAVSSIHVILNGTDITASVSQTPGPLNSLSAPTTVQLTGTLSAQSGSNTLVIAVADLAGNSTSSNVSIQVQALNPTLSLSIISGNGQQGLAGRAATDPLVVQVTDSTTGLPIQGVQVDFSGQQNGGTFSLVNPDDIVTDASGFARVSYVYSRTPGLNIVRASFPYTTQSQVPADFSLTGNLPTVEDATTFSLCNLMPSTSEFPGSAIRRIITVRARKPDGTLLTGELVRPLISSFNGSAPTFIVGKFLPSQAFTDANGQAQFAFVIDKNALPGSFVMQFGLAAFRDANNQEVSLTISGGVLDPTKRGAPSVSIDFSFQDASGNDMSGQSQIGAPSVPLSLQLRVVAPSSAALYTIIEGSGTLKAGDQGGDQISSGCGSDLALLVFPDSSTKKASARFTPTSSLALIALTPASDVFAVGPPELSIVSQNQTGDFVEMPDLYSVSLANASDDFAIQAKAIVPKGTIPAVDLMALNSQGALVTAIPRAVASTQINSSALNMQISTALSTPVQDTWISAAKVISTNDLVALDGTATGGAGSFTPISTTVYGGLQCSLSVAGAAPTPLKISQAKFEAKEAFMGRTPLIFYKTFPGSKVPTTIHYEFGLAKGESVISVTWTLGGDPAPVQTITGVGVNSIDVQYVDGKSDNTVNPVQVKVDETIPANKRKNILITANVQYNSPNPKPGGPPIAKTVPTFTVLRIALNATMSPGATPPPAASQAGLLKARNWTPPANQLMRFNGTKIVPADWAVGPLTPAMADALANKQDDTGAPLGLAQLTANRPTFSKSGGNFTLIRTPLQPPPVAPANPNTGVFGSVVGTTPFNYDLETVQAIADHESQHVIFMADANAGRPFLFTAFLKEINVARPPDTPSVVSEIAAFHEVTLYFDSMNNANLSYRFLNDSSPRVAGGATGFEAHVVQYWNAIYRSIIKKEVYQRVIEGEPWGNAYTPLTLDPTTTTTGLLQNLLNDQFKAYVAAFPELEPFTEFRLPAASRLLP